MIESAEDFQRTGDTGIGRSGLTPREWAGLFFRKKDEPQRLNLEVPKTASSVAPPAPPQPASQLPGVGPERLEAINRRAKEILNSGRITEWLYVCQIGNGLLTFQPGAGQKPVMLLFSHPFGAADYLRATATSGRIGQLKVETLSQSAQSWLTAGAQFAVLDRCPRCPRFLTIPLADMAKWSKEDFAKMWSIHRAARSVLGETRIRSAMQHLAAGSRAAARADLEYVRDHFDCGIPYLHQMIGLLAGMEQDTPAKSAAVERLQEFGAQFAGPLDFSPELLATATVGLMANFGITIERPAPK